MRRSVLTCSIVLAMYAWTIDAKGPKGNHPPPEEHQSSQQNNQHEPNETSPVRGIHRDDHNKDHAETAIELRTLNGTNNNLEKPFMGSAHIQLERIAASDYADEVSTVGGESRPSARAINNAVFSQPESKPNTVGATDFLWQWGQFLDHDIDLTDGVTPNVDVEIPIPAGDIFFDPENTGTQVMTINRSVFDEESGTSPTNPRQQINEITAWIDASNVYGSDVTRSNALRMLDGSGKLKTSAMALLPFNVEGLANAGGTAETLFLAGDVRANEQLGLTVMHTLFVREHNYHAEKIRQNHPSYSGEEIFQKARRMVIAEMQVITYKEFLPMVLGDNALRPYEGYKPQVDANVTNEFSTGAYRFGHTLLSSQILRLDEALNESEYGHLALRDAFFRPDRLITEGGIEPILRGLANQVCQSLDSYIIDDVRNFLFGQPGSGGFDLASLNIMRGRDHGLASYNDILRALGLAAKTSFAHVTDDPVV